MNLNDLDQKILEFLIEKGDYVTSQELSVFFKVSTKTIFRRIKNLRESLGIDIIESDRSRGYKINLNEYVNIINDFYTYNDQPMSVESRRLSILFNLLTKSPSVFSVAKLSEQYFVSQSSIVNDLEIIENRLEDSHLKLSRSNLGTSIQGEEKYIRKELMHILNKQLIDMETPVLSALTTKNESIQNLSGEFEKENVHRIKDILDKANKKLGYSIQNPYYINLLTHLLIMLSRNTSNVTLPKIKYDIDYIDEIKYRVAEYIITEIEEIFRINIDKEEINYVYTFLISTRDTENNEQFELNNNPTFEGSKLVVSFVTALVSRMEMNLKINFIEDDLLINSLIQHVQPMFNRIKYNIVIVNPLIDDIKEEFSKTFHSLEEIIKELAPRYDLEGISSDEVGYLVLYFQNSIEKAMRQFNILIVCSTGIGSSHFLKTRVSNNFPLFIIKDVISANELKEYDKTEIDFVLTTVNLPNIEVPHLLIGALLDKGDINIIKQFIKQNFGGK